MKAMIFAAGLGTRLKPLTDTKPKALVEVAGKPMITHVIEKLKRAGFTQIVVNVHHFAEQIIDFLAANNNFGVDIQISDERNMLLDTGGGIKHAAHLLNDGEPFLIHNVDIISNVDLRDFYNTQLHSNALATLLATPRKTSRYLYFNKENRLCGWKNIKTNETKWHSAEFSADDCVPLAFGGMHVVSPKFFDNFGTWNGKFSVIDFYLSLAEKFKIQAYTPQNLRWLDLGKPETLHEAAKEFSDLL